MRVTEIPFEIAAQFMESDSFDVRVLDQASVWVDKRATVWKLDEAFPRDYALNLLTFLEKCAGDLRMRALQHEEEAALRRRLDPEEILAWAADRDHLAEWSRAGEWIRTTPLYRRLVELADAAAWA